MGAGRRYPGVTMTERTKQILLEVMKLPEAERAELAVETMATLDEGDVDTSEVEAAWATEIERRIEGLLSGKDTATPWAEIRSEALRRLGGGEQADRRPRGRAAGAPRGDDLV